MNSTRMRKQRIPLSLLPYLPKEPEDYSQLAVRAFHDYTGRGVSSWKASFHLNAIQSTEYKDLIDAHEIASHNPSGLLEGLWAEGIRDYPMRVMLQDMIRDGISNTKTWFRKLPCYERAYKFSVRIHDDHEKTRN